ncbi:50S ribosomal protein L7/L12 [Candidatus Sneabacter namystus]|uniref:Large ribosomal subunit protein bL12 n=1 Tax=Candidatus Sneabacter namystus TaxID=2601646 RepID=A0A5C0UI38_9RICK|nr:50S ribosomal protein L7/L12 [Candidatus Sneabacter namystus]QEK39736.1 50S ribosomal protein L7/L12 [Candidatus Sneabacter namystus]
MSKSVVQSIVDQVMDMKMMDVAELVQSMTEELKKRGIDPTPVPTAVVAAASSSDSDSAAAASSFDVIIAGVGDKKMQVIKEVRTITSLGLKEAKDLVDSAPGALVKSALSTEEANKVKEQLESAGAQITLKASA